MAKFPTSPEAIAALPAIERTGYSRAMLVNLDTNEKWWFLLNPSTLNYRSTVNYATGALIGVNRQPIAWVSTDGLGLELTDLILDTTAERKSCRAAIDRLVELGRATPSKGRPPLLSFVWGEQSLSPCVIVGDIAWTETGHVNGVAVRARLSFNLREAGDPKPLILTPSITPIPSTSNSGGIPIPRPSQNPVPVPVPEPGTTPTQPAQPSIPGTGNPADEAAMDKVGYGAGISLSSASAFAVAPRKVLTAAHMVKSVGETVRMQLRGNDSSVEKSFSGTVKAINSNLDAAWIEVDFDFEIYWQFADESKLKKGDRCVAYGHPAGGSQFQEKTTGVFTSLGSGSQGVIFGMTDSKTRLLYPGNSGGGICCGQLGSSEYGKIISLTSGGDGRPSQGDTISNWQNDKCYGPRISQVKAAFSL